MTPQASPNKQASFTSHSVYLSILFPPLHPDPLFCLAFLANRSFHLWPSWWKRKSWWGQGWNYSTQWFVALHFLPPYGFFCGPDPKLSSPLCTISDYRCHASPRLWPLLKWFSAQNKTVKGRNFQGDKTNMWTFMKRNGCMYIMLGEVI